MLKGLTIGLGTYRLVLKTPVLGLELDSLP